MHPGGYEPMNYQRMKSSLLFDNKQLWSVGFIVMIRSIGFGSTWPFMAIFFNTDLGVPVYLVGVIFGVLAISSTGCQIIGGHMTDFSGRKRTMMLGSGIGLVVYLSIILSLLFHFSVLIISVLFVATSLSGGFLFPAATAAVADVTSSENREKGYAIYRILANVGWAVGPLIGSQIFDAGVIWIFVLVEISLVIQFTLILAFLAETSIRREQSRRASMLSDFFVLDKALIYFSAGTLLLMILTSQFSVTLPLYAVLKVHVLSRDIGYIFMVNGIVVVLGQLPMTSIVSRYREVDAVILGMLFYIAGYLLAAFSTSLIALMFDMAIITTGENLTTPSVTSIVSRIAPVDRMGRYMAFNGMANSTGRALGPAVGSFFLYLFFGSNVAIWLALDTFGIASLAIMLIVRQKRFVEKEGNELVI